MVTRRACKAHAGTWRGARAVAVPKFRVRSVDADLGPSGIGAREVLDVALRCSVKGMSDARGIRDPGVPGVPTLTSRSLRR